MVLAGVALVAPELYQRLPTFGEPRFGNMAASVLVLLGAMSGLLATRQMRRTCRQLGLDLDAMRAAGDIKPLQAADASLRPLIESMNRALQFSLEKSADAKRKLRELEIQLKVVQLEREHAESIIHSISDAVLVTDPFDDLVMANESASRALGFAIPEIGRKPIEQLLHDPKLISLIRDMRASKSVAGRRIIEHRVRVEDKERTFKVTLSCLAGNRTDGSGVVAVLQDKTHETEVAQMKNSTLR